MLSLVMFPITSRMVPLNLVRDPGFTGSAVTIPMVADLPRLLDLSPFNLHHDLLQYILG
jgi:hypothetical protein